MLVNLLRREKRGLSFMETALVTGGSGLIGKHIVSGLLEKGYALVLGADGRLLSSAAGTGAGDRLTILFRDGKLRTRVEKVEFVQNLRSYYSDSGDNERRTEVCFRAYEYILDRQ